VTAAAASAAAAAPAFVVLVGVIVGVPVTAAASAFVGVFMLRQSAERVFFHHQGDFVEYGGVLVHLGFKRRVLFRDGAEERRGVAQQLRSELSVGWHGRESFRD
jgi:hypothetical protein